VGNAPHGWAREDLHRMYQSQQTPHHKNQAKETLSSRLTKSEGENEGKGKVVLKK